MGHVCTMCVRTVNGGPQWKSVPTDIGIRPNRCPQVGAGRADYHLVLNGIPMNIRFLWLCKQIFARCFRNKKIRENFLCQLYVEETWKRRSVYSITTNMTLSNRGLIPLRYDTVDVSYRWGRILLMYDSVDLLWRYRYNVLPEAIAWS
jgi:hypothetical protein